MPRPLADDGGRRGLLAEARAAVAIVCGWRGLAASLPRETLGGGLAFVPAAGLGIGIVAAVVAAVVARALPGLAGLAGVVVLVALSGARPVRGLAAAAELLRRGDARPWPGPLGIAVASGALGVELWAATVAPPPVRTTALVFAPMLGAWAFVVQCYGGTPLGARGLGAALLGRARFREFGWASLVALGVALGAADALGLVVVLVAALVTVGVRVWAHRRVGGLTGRMLGATRQLVEVAVLGVLALLAS